GRIGKVDYVEVGLLNGTPGPERELLAEPDNIDWDMWQGPAPWRPYQNFGKGLSKRSLTQGGPHYWWRHILDYSGGKLTDWGAHHVDIAHWGLGLDRTGPVEIEGVGTYPTEGIFDVPYKYDFYCTYATGIKIRIANEGLLKTGRGVCWYGKDGWIHVSRNGMKSSIPGIEKEKILSSEIRLYKSSDHKRNFIDCIKNRKETATPAEIAHRSNSVSLLGEIAMLTGRKLKWDSVKESFVDDSDADKYLMRPYRSGWTL
ncbi:MAG: hypothetical protein MI922_27270, partial [Bacteroidales bacterium]|nr:hypothetical protein [Bacteroidales bacterium]